MNKWKPVDNLCPKNILILVTDGYSRRLAANFITCWTGTNNRKLDIEPKFYDLILDALYVRKQHANT